MTSPASLTLLIFSVDGQIPAQRISLRQAMVSVGREDDNTVVLTDPTVSRHHFTLTQGADSTWRMERKPEARSLYFNGEPRDTATAEDGDQIVIGQTVIHIEAPETPVQASGNATRTILSALPVPHLLVECPGIRFQAPLRQGTVTLGRAPGNNIIVPSLVIGAQHAIMQRDAHGRYTIQASGAINSFMYDGAQVRSHTWQQNDTLLVGARESGQYAALTYLDPQELTASTEALPLDAGNVITIGRDPASDLHLPNPMISWRHARFSRNASGRPVLQDLGSRNGTYVNYTAITHAQTLNVGDRVQFGPYSFRFDGATLAPVTTAAAGIRIDASGLTRTTNHGRTTLRDYSGGP